MPDVSRRIQTLFGVQQVKWYGVRGERDRPGIVETPHWPVGFDRIRQTLVVPFKGAVFLVGAGPFGKIYCHWIKQRGGIAIDIGSIFDSWAGIGRVGHSARSLEAYVEHPEVTRREAVDRHNDMLPAFNLSDVGKVGKLGEFDALPESW